MIRIRSKVDGLSVPPNLVLDKGQEGDCPTDRAKTLFAQGKAEPVDPADKPLTAPEQAARIEDERARATRSAQPEKAVKKT